MSADDKTRISPQVANTAVGTQLGGHRAGKFCVARR